MEFITAPIPAAYSKYDELKQVLLALPAGQSVVIGLNVLSGQAETILRMKRQHNRPARQKMCRGCAAMPEPHIHVWLEPVAAIRKSV